MKVFIVVITIILNAFSSRIPKTTHNRGRKQSAKVFRILFDPYLKVKDVSRKINNEFL